MMTDPDSLPEVAKDRPRRFQVGLRSIFWLTAAIAVWIAVFINRRETERLEAKVQSLRPIARDLIVDDPAKIAVVKLDDLWNDEERWDIYLPPGTYQAHLATSIVEDTGLPLPSQSVPIGPGRHRLGMTVGAVKSGTRVEVTLDGEPLMKAEEPWDWAGSGWVSRGDISTSEQRPADQPLVIHRRQISKVVGPGRMTRNAGSTEGVLLWITRKSPTEPARER